MSNYSENKMSEAQNHAWSLIFEKISKGSTVLDVGCSSGNLGSELIKQKECFVDGIEVNKTDAKKAAEKLRRVYTKNVELDSLSSLSDRYDFIVMADVIEHLLDPVATLEKLKKLLTDEGKLIFSIPNMAHTSVRLELLKGHFQYTDTGLLDATHLYFYTGEKIKEVISSSGYKLLNMQVTSKSYNLDMLEKELNKVGLSATNEFKQVLHDTQGDVYQYIGLIKPSKKESIDIELPKSNQYETTVSELEKETEEYKKQIKLKDDHIENLKLRADSLGRELNIIKKSKPFKAYSFITKFFSKRKNQ